MFLPSRSIRPPSAHFCSTSAFPVLLAAGAALAALAILIAVSPPIAPPTDATFTLLAPPEIVARIPLGAIEKGIL